MLFFGKAMFLRRVVLQMTNFLQKHTRVSKILQFKIVDNSNLSNLMKELFGLKDYLLISLLCSLT